MDCEILAYTFEPIYKLVTMGGQKIKCRPIRTREIGVVRLQRGTIRYYYLRTVAQSRSTKLNHLNDAIIRVQTLKLNPQWA